MYGNTYIFPYIVNNSTLINGASNESEWDSKNASFSDSLKNAIQGIANAIGDTAAGVMGSSA